MDSMVTILMVAAAVFLLWLTLKILRTPMKWALKLLTHMAMGFVGLIVLNYIGKFIGVTLAVNWLTSLIAGVLGVPGVILLLLIKYLL